MMVMINTSKASSKMTIKCLSCLKTIAISTKDRRNQHLCNACRKEHRNLEINDSSVLKTLRRRGAKKGRYDTQQV